MGTLASATVSVTCVVPGSFGVTLGGLDNGFAVESDTITFTDSRGTPDSQQWQESADRITWTNLSGETSATIVPSANATVGRYLRVRSTKGGVTVESEGSVLIVDTPAQETSPPVIGSAPTIAGQPVQGVQLTATYGPATGIPTPTNSGRWLRNGVTQVGTGTTYTLQAADVGNYLVFEQTATNIVSSATRLSAQTATITASDTTDPVVESSDYTFPELTALVTEANPSKAYLCLCNSGDVAYPPSDAEMVAGSGGGILEQNIMDIVIGQNQESHDWTNESGDVIRIMIEDLAGNYSLHEVIAVPIDTTAPTVSSVTGTKTGETTATWGATSNEAGGTMFAAARLASDPALTAEEIEGGLGNALATSQDTSPTADANNGGSFTGLSAGTEYDVDVFQRDTAGNDGAVASSAASFTTDSPASLTTPQRLVVYRNSTETIKQFETPVFVPQGTGPIVVNVYICNWTAAAAASVVSADIGASGRGFGSGTDADRQVAAQNSRANTLQFVFKNPGASGITFQLELSAIPRGVVFEIIEVPGSTSAQAGDTDAKQGSGTGNSLDVTVGTNAWTIYAVGLQYLSTTINWTGATAFDQTDSGDTNQFRDLAVRSAYEQGTGAIGASVSWTGSSSYAATAIEVQP